MYAEALVVASDVPGFVDRAVELVNDRLFGSLAASLVVSSSSLADVAVSQAVTRALRTLRYGRLDVNAGAGAGRFLATPSVGPFPPSRVDDVQSGCGKLGNAMFLPATVKCVVTSPFTHKLTTRRNLYRLSQRLTWFETQPSPLKLPALLWAALKG